MAAEMARVRAERSGFSSRLVPDLCDNETRQDWTERLRACLDTQSGDVAAYILDILSRVGNAPNENTVNALLAAVAGGNPGDPQELLLLTQMACVSQLMTDTLLRLTAPHLDPLDKEELSRIASRFGHLYARQMESLRKYRRTGQQTMTIVHAGQAIVGDVTTGRGDSQF